VSASERASDGAVIELSSPMVKRLPPEWRASDDVGGGTAKSSNRATESSIPLGRSLTNLAFLSAQAAVSANLELVSRIGEALVMSSGVEDLRIWRVTEPTLADMLADPIFQALIAAYRLDTRQVENALRDATRRAAPSLLAGGSDGSGRTVYAPGLPAAPGDFVSGE